MLQAHLGLEVSTCIVGILRSSVALERNLVTSQGQ